MPLLEPLLEFVKAVRHQIPLQAQNDLDRRQTRLTLDLQEISNAGTDRRGGFDWRRIATLASEKDAGSREKTRPINDPPRRCVVRPPVGPAANVVGAAIRLTLRKDLRCRFIPP
jgi:hypothetical protein